MSAGITDKTWYYVKNGQTVGPLRESEMRMLVKDGVIAPATFVWREGQADWVRASDSLFSAVFEPEQEAVPDIKPLPQSVLGQKPEFSADSLYRLWAWFALIAGSSVPIYFILIQHLTQKMVTVAIIGVAIAASIFCYMLLYRLWQLIQDGQARTTPSKAVVFCLVPIYNIYWNYIAYVGLVLDINRYCDEHNIAGPRVNEVMAKVWYGLLLCAVLPGIGAVASLPAIILQLVLLRQLVDVASAIIRAKNSQ